MSKRASFKNTYFIDRALGKSVGKALQNLGVKIKFHNDHFAPDSPDTEWLPIISQKGWIVLTKDVRISLNPLEVLAIASSNAKVFTLVSGNITREQITNIFVERIEKIDKIASSNKAPFIAKIYQSQPVQIWKNNNELNKLLK